MERIGLGSYYRACPFPFVCLMQIEFMYGLGATCKKTHPDEKQ